MNDYIKITMTRSLAATTPNQKKNLLGLGLHRRERPVFRKDSESLRGMIRKVIHLVDVERVAEPKIAGRRSGVAVKITPGKVEIKKKTKVVKAKGKKSGPKKAQGKEEKTAAVEASSVKTTKKVAKKKVAKKKTAKKEK